MLSLHGNYFCSRFSWLSQGLVQQGWSPFHVLFFFGEDINCFAASGIILPFPFLQAASLTMQKSTRPRLSYLYQHLRRDLALRSVVSSNCRCARIYLNASRCVRSLMLKLHHLRVGILPCLRGAHPTRSSLRKPFSESS
jgi:hypothetical protein